MADHGKALEILHKGVGDLVASERWAEALKFRSKFHSYSPMNTLLIYLQAPHASRVAGFKTWQSLGRQVRKGEKGIAISRPMTKRVVDEDGSERFVKIGFGTTHVFDVSQTDGEPLPDVDVVVDLQGTSDDLQSLLGRLRAFSQASGFPVSHASLNGPKGCFEIVSGKIVLEESLEDLQAVKTLAHELAHALLHRDGKGSRAFIELEAESTAFLVCHALGIDVGDYSFGYLAHWGGTPDELVKASTNAAKAADLILEGIRS